jgi:large subunit ribosomal protein L35
MGKLKTHKATAKRFKVSKSGKLQFEAPGFGHLNSKKDAVVKYRKNRTRIVSSTMARKLKKLLPGTSTK